MEITEKTLKTAEDLIENNIEADDFEKALTLCEDILSVFPNNEKSIFYKGYISIVSKHFNLIRSLSVFENSLQKTMDLLSTSLDNETEKTIRYENYINKTIKVLHDIKNKLYKKVFPMQNDKPDFSTEHMYNAFELYTCSIAPFIKKFWDTHLNTPLFKISKMKIDNLKRDIIENLEWPISVLGSNLLYKENDIEAIKLYFSLYDLYTEKRTDWLSTSFPEKYHPWSSLEPKYLSFKKEVKKVLSKNLAEKRAVKMQLQKASFLSKNKIQKRLYELENEENSFLKTVVNVVNQYALEKRNNGWMDNMSYNNIEVINPVLSNYKETRMKELEAKYKEEYKKYLEIELNEPYIMTYKNK